MSSGPKYGHIIGDGHGARHLLTTAEYYNEKGGHFVSDQGSGKMGLCDATSDVIVGWADTGKLVGYGSNWFLTVATSDALVIMGHDNVFRVPAFNTVSISDIGKRYMLAYIGTSTTTSDFIQIVRNTGTTVALGKVEVYDVDADDIANKTLQVKIII